MFLYVKPNYSRTRFQYWFDSLDMYSVYTKTVNYTNAPFLKVEYGSQNELLVSK